MRTTTPQAATIPEVAHHHVDLNGTRLHYVSAGTSGSPILLVHGWPETWWAFHKLIPLLSATHRVYAVDLRGFGDSSHADTAYGAAVSADDLHALISHIGAGPVHLVSQDISGAIAFRLGATHPEDLASFIVVESTLPGFGLEALADVNAGGSWHVGFLGAPGIPEMLLAGHERELLAGWAYPVMNGTRGAISEDDVEEFVRTYSGPNAWRGTVALYQEVFSDAGATRALADAHPLTRPVLTVDGASAPFTENTFRQVSVSPITAEQITGVGHLVAQEAPEQLAELIVDFAAHVDADPTDEM